ncbi:putative reverse transcriptase domain-containing protein [Tanacetum coccineum]
MANDDPILTTMRFIPQHEVVQRYGVVLPDYLTNPTMKESEAYKTYHDLATGKVQPKPKYVRRSSKTKTDEAPKPSSGKRVKSTAKLAIKQSLIQTHSLHASGSGTHEGTGVTPGVPDVPDYESDDEQISWKSNKEEDDDEVNVSKHDDDDDDERTKSDNDGEEFVHPKFLTHDDEARQEEITCILHVPRNVNRVNARNPTVRACYECGSTDHVRSACPRFNRAQGPKGNRPNQVAANNGGQGRGNQGNQDMGRAFTLGAEEARQDPNILTDTFTLNNHFATTLFDSGADYSFVSTTFIPLLGIEPSELGFIYKIKIASGQLVEIDKVIKGCKEEIEGHVFDIDLIPFGYGSFDVIIGMDWLSNHKAKIISHEKVVRIPLLDGKVLRVLGEKPEEKMRQLKSAKAKEKEQEEIVVVRYFPEVFPDDLSGLPPVREMEFQIELIIGATSVAKSPYSLVSHPDNGGNSGM